MFLRELVYAFSVGDELVSEFNSVVGLDGFDLKGGGF
jgi:hypothetical protein